MNLGIPCPSTSSWSLALQRTPQLLGCSSFMKTQVSEQVIFAVCHKAWLVHLQLPHAMQKNIRGRQHSYLSLDTDIFFPTSTSDLALHPSSDGIPSGCALKCSKAVAPWTATHLFPGAARGSAGSCVSCGMSSGEGNCQWIDPGCS